MEWLKRQWCMNDVSGGFKVLSIREQLADLAHQQWKRQTQTPYQNLSAEEQDSDRKEADRLIKK